MMVFLRPLLEFGDSEEVDRFLPMTHSDDGSNELDEEIGELEKRRIKVVEEVDDKPLDVRTIVILKSNVTKVFRYLSHSTYLIGHDHNPSITQAVPARVLLVVLQAHNFPNVLYFFILHDLIVACFADIEEFTTEREDTKVITSNNRETCHCQCLCGVTFCEDEGAVLAVARASVVRVAKFGHSVQAILPSVRPTTQSCNNQPRTFATVLRLHLFISFEFGPIENIVDDCRL